MNKQPLVNFPFETERYELYPEFELDRRDFFRIVGGGLVVAIPP